MAATDTTILGMVRLGGCVVQRQREVGSENQVYMYTKIYLSSAM